MNVIFHTCAGEEGAKALMLVPITVGQRVKCTASGCNLVMRDSKCWFDAKNPCRRYRLNLSHPFERAVAFLCLRIVATHPTYIFAKFDFMEDGESKMAYHISFVFHVVSSRTEDI